MSRRNELKKGFTLIELLIAIAIVMLLATIGAPKIREILAKGKDAKAVGFLGAVRTVKSSLLVENTMATGREDGWINLTMDVIFDNLDMKEKDYIDTKMWSILVGGSRENETSEINYSPVVCLISSSEKGTKMVGVTTLKLTIKDIDGKEKEVDNSEVLIEISGANGQLIKPNFYVNKKSKLHLFDLSGGTSSFKDSFYSVEGKQWTSY